MKRTNKRQITKGLQEIGAAWAVRDDKYICTNWQCCQVLDGDRPAYHIHPHADEPRQDSIKRFRNLDEIAGYLEARKAVSAAFDAEMARSGDFDKATEIAYEVAQQYELA